LCGGEGIFDFSDFLIGELVTALVTCVSGVAFDPFPFDLVERCDPIEFPPKIRIFNRFLGRGFPAIPLPGVQPARDAILQILRVGVELDMARPFQSLQGLNRSEKFHPVIRRGRLATGDFPRVRPMGEDGRPTPGSGITMTSAVSMDHDLFQFFSLLPEFLSSRLFLCSDWAETAEEPE